MAKEPILILIGGGTVLIQAILTVLVTVFHVPISTEGQAAITALAGVLLAAYARSHVVPIATVEADAKARTAAQKPGERP